ncbi:MAG TPA: ribosome biogenesis GTP-binding protein YihA/YsxC [Pyrinomonadaceae bacterium]|jgi:GTP-binding protein|nr:ribosome biogenesis GTP-binding protein YihA/YsxC [Pyrinomonadaceae bacterium]
MKITTTEFVKSAFAEEHWPRAGVPEIAFLGRSNVGKSSVINSLLGVRGLARTSSTPGRTQALNFFLINRRFHFVDLPGYGYARVPRDVRESWGKIVTDYLANRESLVLSIHIVDSRHEPTKSDLQLREWLKAYAKSALTVATKSDKLSQNELQRNITRLRQALGAVESGEVVAYSAVTRRGREEIWRTIERALTHNPPS